MAGRCGATHASNRSGVTSAGRSNVPETSCIPLCIRPTRAPGLGRSQRAVRERPRAKVGAGSQSCPGLWIDGAARGVACAEAERSQDDGR